MAQEGGGLGEGVERTTGSARSHEYSVGHLTSREIVHALSDGTEGVR